MLSSKNWSTCSHDSEEETPVPPLTKCTAIKSFPGTRDGCLVENLSCVCSIFQIHFHFLQESSLVIFPLSVVKSWPSLSHATWFTGIWLRTAWEGEELYRSLMFRLVWVKICYSDMAAHLLWRLGCFFLSIVQCLPTAPCLKFCCATTFQCSLY